MASMLLPPPTSSSAASSLFSRSSFPTPTPAVTLSIALSLFHVNCSSDWIQQVFFLSYLEIDRRFWFHCELLCVFLSYYVSVCVDRDVSWQGRRTGSLMFLFSTIRCCPSTCNRDDWWLRWTQILLITGSRYSPVLAISRFLRWIHALFSLHIGLVLLFPCVFLNMEHNTCYPGLSANLLVETLALSFIYTCLQCQ